MLSTSGYILRYRQGNGPWIEYPLTSDIVIGRSQECDLCVDDEMVSRKHAKLTLHPDGVYITDLGSSNGTKIGINLIPIQTPFHLEASQIFSMGNITLLLVKSDITSQSDTSQEVTSTEKILPTLLLWYRQGNEPWQQHPIVGSVIIGRGTDCNLLLDDHKVSRHHARISLDAGVVHITDLGSQNGTRIDNHIIPQQEPQILAPGKSFSIGSHTFILGQPGITTPPKEPFQPPVPPPIFAPELQQPSSYIPSPKDSMGFPHSATPVHQPIAYPVSSSPLPKKKGIGLWVIFAIGGLVIIFCFCIGAAGLFLFPIGTPTTDVAATQQVLQLTQLALVETPLTGGTEIPSTVETPIPIIEESPASELPQPDVSSDTQTWLVMVYADADDSVLETGMFIDLDEAELTGSSDRVQIVWQLDRYNEAFTGDGDWTSTKRFYVTQNQDLGHIGSEEIYDMGEVNMGDPNTLVDFAIWAISTYPADKYVLIMSDHGSGWPGGWSDNDPVQESSLWLNQIDEALSYVVSQTGISQFELIGFDACLMAQLEVFSAISPYAKYAVASEETEPLLGWPYGDFLDKLVNNPSMNGADLARSIVDGYINQDIIIVNDEYRNSYTQGTNLEGASADQVAATELQEITMTAIDLSVIPKIHSALNKMTSSMQTINQQAIAEARTYAQSYENIFGEEIPPSYLDLLNFAQFVYDRSGDPNIGLSVEELTTAISQAVIAEKHGDNRPGSTGISIYFPNSVLWQFTDYNENGIIYNQIANRFANESFWDEFLEFHYTGNPF